MNVNAMFSSVQSFLKLSNLIHATVVTSLLKLNLSFFWFQISMIMLNNCVEMISDSSF